MCEWYGATTLAYNYERSFHNRRLGAALFGGDGILRFAGSQVADRQSDELIADFFGLSSAFRGNIAFAPRIQNHIVDASWYIGLDNWKQGSWMRLQTAFAHTSYELNYVCGCDTSVTTSAANGAFTSCEVEDAAAATILTGTPSACDLIVEALDGSGLFGDMQTAWTSGKFHFGKRHVNALADIDVDLGYNFKNKECYSLGIYAKAVIPTSHKPNSEYVFTIPGGNGGHFELGGGLTAHKQLWTSKCSGANFAFYFDGYVTHMFKNTQCRLFDFCDNGAYSRYLLLKEFDSNGADYIYNGHLARATEFNNRKVNVSVGARSELAFKFAWRSDKITSKCGIWGIDFGYNLSAQTAEKISWLCDSCTNTTTRYGIQGLNGVCCNSYVTNATEITTGPTTSRVDNTLDNASMYTPIYQGNGTIPQSSTVCLAWNSTVPANPTLFTDATRDNGYYIITDQTPTILDGSTSAIFDLDSAASPASLNSRIFIHTNYAWNDECGWNPQIGIGGEAQFASRNCERFGVNMWGVWIKGGVTF